MAYNTPPIRNPMELVQASDWNADIVDNFKASAPGVFAAKGDLFVGTGAKAGAKQATGADGSMLVSDTTETNLVRWVGHTGEQEYIDYYVSSNTNITDNTLTVVNFDTKVIDAASAMVTTGAAWKFTAPVKGFYLASICISLIPTNAWDLATGGKLVDIGLYIDGSATRYTRFQYWKAVYSTGGRPTLANKPIRLFGSVPVPLNATQYFSVKILTTAGATVQIQGSSVYSWISIARLA
jgi:hypothetical protein